MVVTTNAADTARDEVRVAWIFALHEEAIASEDVGGAKGLCHPPVLEVDLRIDAQTANDTSHRIPRHLYKLWWLGRGLFSSSLRTHGAISFIELLYAVAVSSWSPCSLVTCCEFPPFMPPRGFFVDRIVRQLT